MRELSEVRTNKLLDQRTKLWIEPRYTSTKLLDCAIGIM